MCEALWFIKKAANRRDVHAVYGLPVNGARRCVSGAPGRQEEDQRSDRRVLCCRPRKVTSRFRSNRIGGTGRSPSCHAHQGGGPDQDGGHTGEERGGAYPDQGGDPKTQQGDCSEDDPPRLHSDEEQQEEWSGRQPEGHTKEV